MAYATVDDLAAALRVQVTTKNSQLLQDCVDAGATEIDHALDRVDPLPTPPPAIVKLINVDYGVELYKLNDAVFGGVGFADIGILRVPADGFARYATMLTPLKQQFGVA